RYEMLEQKRSCELDPDSRKTSELDLQSYREQALADLRSYQAMRESLAPDQDGPPAGDIDALDTHVDLQAWAECERATKKPFAEDNPVDKSLRECLAQIKDLDTT